MKSGIAKFEMVCRRTHHEWYAQRDLIFQCRMCLAEVDLKSEGFPI